MPNIIRPTFGAKPERPGPDDWTPVEVIGAVAGYIVGLHRSVDAEIGPMIRVVVGKEGSVEITAVTVYPDDLEADQDARACAQAVLLGIGIVGGDGPKVA